MPALRNAAHVHTVARPRRARKESNAPRIPAEHDTSTRTALEKRAALTSGADAWHLNGLSESTSYMITDGPHGLRKAAQSTSMDIEHSMPATCFPPAAGMASSWNPGLVREVGVAIGEECVQEKVAVLLGPGVNIKRNPLGGRSFEFW